ncbi:MAG: porin family protein [Prevotella sp.]|nr:porin family protein [Prevotella sp.]
MKKLIVLAVVMMASLGAYAQHAPGSLTIQPRIGLSAADFNSTYDTEARVGLVAGAELEYQINNWLSLAGGVNYSQQGADEKVQVGSMTWELDYLTVPMVANFYVLKGLALKAGLQPGFKLNAKLEREANGHSDSADLENVKGFDLAMPVGLSYEFKRFVIDARYNVGLLEVADDTDIKNLGFQLTLGYKFSLK